MWSLILFILLQLGLGENPQVSYHPAELQDWWISYPRQQGVVGYNLGQYYVEAQEWDSARYYLHQSIRFLPDTLASEAENALGWIDIQENSFQSALRQFRKALYRNPTNEDARINYELAYRILNQNRAESPEPMHAPTQIPIPSHSQNQGIQGTEDAPTFLRDSLNLDLISDLLLQIRDQEYPYVQELKRRPRNFPLSQNKPNW